jgi:hypothetical protein
MDNSNNNTYYKFENGSTADSEKYQDAVVFGDDLTPKKRSWKYTNQCLWVTLGIIFTVGFELLAFVSGWVQLPSSSTSLAPPQCYACVGVTLDGNYQSQIEYTESGIQFKVKLYQHYHADTGTVEIIVDVIKDPVGIFTACDCTDVPFRLGSVNCTIDTIYDDCVNECNDANGIKEQVTLYDPKKDQVESSIIVTVLSVSVPQVAIFTRVPDDPVDDDDTPVLFTSKSIKKSQVQLRKLF